MKVHMLNERIMKFFCLWCWPAFWHESQMPTQAGLTYGSISSLCREKLQSNARGWAVLELNGALPLLSWLKKRVFWFQSHWNNAIDAKTAGQFDSSIIMKWFALNFLVHSEQWMSCGRWKSAQQKICASTSQLGLYLMNILIFVSTVWLKLRCSFNSVGYL